MNEISFPIFHASIMEKYTYAMCGAGAVAGSNNSVPYFDRNPALESQACDRIYRVGQQNDVVIHR